MNFSSLLSEFEVKDIVKSWLKEDLPSFDVGGFVVGILFLAFVILMYCDLLDSGDSPREANILFKTNGVVAGIPFAQGLANPTLYLQYKT
jgi:nicotinate-nucleotide pyrophosphorylase